MNHPPQIVYVQQPAKPSSMFALTKNCLGCLLVLVAIFVALVLVGMLV